MKLSSIQERISKYQKTVSKFRNGEISDNSFEKKLLEEVSFLNNVIQIESLGNYENSVESKLNRKKIGSSDLPDVTVSNITKSLYEFEASKRFLSQNISLNSLAAECNTNTKYLSKVVNSYKGKTFKNYINDLRVHYFVENYTKKAEYKKYSIHAIAKDLGFNTLDAFSKAFHKKMGKHPSFYLNELKNSK